MSRHEELDERNAQVLAEVEREDGCTCTPHLNLSLSGEVQAVWWEADPACPVDRPKTSAQWARISRFREAVGR